MPVKLDFQVISCTGEDEKYRASELNYLGPTVRGWRSPTDGTFPQEIILKLKVVANLQQIQILSHQYLIPEKIELFISNKHEQDILCKNFTDFFEYLGFITFSDNKATRFHSRELKSILIPSKKAKYVKLRIYNNHINDKNVYNQVALIAINILGEEWQCKTDENEMNNNLPSSTSHSANLLNNISPYDDLAFHMSVDEETAKIIKLLESKMLQAIYYDRLEYVNTLEITLENLRAAGEILGIYEQEKKRAINLEDYDRAKQKKIQIDNFRQKIYNTLHVDQLLESCESLGEYDLNDNADDKSTYSFVNPSKGRQTSRQNLTNGRAPIPSEDVHSFNCEKYPSQFLPPRRQEHSKSPQLLHSQSQTFSDSYAFQNSSFTTSSSNLHLYTTPVMHPNYKLDASLEQVRTPSSISDSLNEDESSQSNSPENLKHPNTMGWNISLTPRAEPDKSNKSRNPPDEWSTRNKMKASHSEQKIRSKNVTNNVAKSSFEAYEERMLPALRSYHGNEVVRECQLALDQQRKSTLNEREKKQAGLPISVFGMELIEKFYSKSFMDKEEGLKELQQELKNIVKAGEETSEAKPPPYNKMARAVVFLLHRSLRDKVYSVYSLAAETVRIFFAEFVPQRVTQSEVARSVEKLLPELLTKSGDVTPRIHNMAAHTLLSMAECGEVRQLNIIPTQLSRPLTSSVHPRLALSRLEMVEQLILNHGISKDKKSGLTCRTLAEFGSSGLHHPAEAVRKVSERILIQVYKINPRIVRKQLPPDDNVTRRNLLYRQLFQEFDVIDSRKLSEQAIDNSIALEENNQILTNPEIHAKSAASLSGTKTKSITLQPLTNYGKVPLKSPIKVPNALEKPTILKKRENDFRPMKKENAPKQPENGDSILRFPSLTDSIKATKARMEQKTDPKNRINSFLPRENEGILIGSLTKPKLSSGIPIPTNNRKYATKPKANENPKKLEESKSKSKIPSKTIKIRLLDTAEKEPETSDSLRKSIIFCLNESKEYDMEESIKLSESMLASIRENEFTVGTLHGQDESEERLKTCIFCLSSEKWTTEDSLNKHYLRECLMLTTCEYCTEITEIPGLTNHLLDDCKWKHLFQKCKNCHQAILRDLYDKHECPGKAHKSRCLFCHIDVGDDESSWRKHLMGSNMCLHHPRQK